MGAAGHAEYDCWDDNDEYESVWASDLEEEEKEEKEEAGKPSKSGQAKEKALQVVAWLDEVKRSRIDTLGKRRPGWLAEMHES